MSYSVEKQNYYDQFARERGLRSVWSIYTVEDMDADHPYGDVTELLYKEHWGEGPVTAPIKGKTWGDLFTAANQCILSSGDGHHIYIEGFKFKDNTLSFYTGS